MPVYATTYNVIGNIEDISDMITNICPDETPIFSAFKKTKATATYHEWLEDSLADPTDNQHAEGETFVVDDVVPRIRLGNYTQIFHKGYGVTGTQQAVMTHGVKDELAYQMAKASKEIARDVERAYIVNNSKDAGTSSNQKRKLGGVSAFITTNKLANSGTPRELTEALFNDAVQQAWQTGGKPTTCFCSGKNKRVISDFTAGSTKNMDSKAKRAIQVLEVYESDFGVIEMVAHRYLPNTSIFILDMEHWKNSILRPFKPETLPKTADKDEKIIIGELTLEARAEKASAIITDLKA